MISLLLSLALPFALHVAAAPLPASATAEGLDISQSLQNILSNSHNSDAYTYPTDLTRGIAVVSFRPPVVFGYMNTVMFFNRK